MAVVEHYRALTRPAAPLVSVCIAHYKGPELIAACLDSVLAQDCAFDVEIIVHDDASLDDSVAFLRSNYPQIELLVSHDNVGFCVANNRMVEHANGKYVLLLNNDAALFSDALATLAEAAAGQNTPGILTLPQYDWESGDLVDLGCLLDPFYNPVPNLDPDRSEVAMVIGACLWIGRDTWFDLGGFPDWFGSIGEDLYLCCAARLAGLPVQSVQGSGYRHQQGSSFGGNRALKGRLNSNYRRRRFSERNKTFTLFVMTPTIIMWPLLSIHIIALVVEGLIFSTVRRDLKAGINIYLNVLRELTVERSVIGAARSKHQAKRGATLLNYTAPFRVLPHKLAMLRKYGFPTLTQNAKH
ncbi:glycosyltransferase family 2 protein [Haliea salexigens]|uniref:glycosyltransferase family 2 protein n=1 Tax=Haliea salexigens TaxID=287487 RepID=UPI00040506B8|nr:glycosyltransferase [Haliea salexigens]